MKGTEILPVVCMVGNRGLSNWGRNVYWG